MMSEGAPPRVSSSPHRNRGSLSTTHASATESHRSDVGTCRDKAGGVPAGGGVDVIDLMLFVVLSSCIATCVNAATGMPFAAP